MIARRHADTDAEAAAAAEGCVMDGPTDDI
jgi:hypothetical protein